MVKAVVAGLLAAVCIGVGAWYGRALFTKPAPKERPGYHNPGRNYIFYALPPPWKEDRARANRAGFDLVLHRPDLGGWVTLRSELAQEESVDPKEISEQATEKWKERIRDFAPAAQLAKARMAQRDAVVVEGEGTVDGKTVRGRSAVLVAGGVKYVMGFEGPVEEWDRLEPDFALARESLELTGGSAAPAKILGEHEVAVFASKKFPYRLSAPAGSWREVPDLQTDSRFDDLKLQDKARLGEVVVAARETKDLPGMRVRYVETQTRRYENKVRELEGGIEKLTIHRRPAMRTILIVTNAGGDFMLYTTFVQGDGLVFQVQCRAPAEKRDVYEPIFAKIAGSFEVLAKAPAREGAEPAKKDDGTPKSSTLEKPAKDVPAAEKSVPSGTTQPGTPKGEEKDAPMAPPGQKEPAKPEPSKAKAESPKEEKKPDAAKKKKSLDDLD